VTGVPLTGAEAIAVIEAARGPGDLFGSDAARTYRRLAQLTHPDAHPGDARAARAFAKLADLWRRHRDGHGALVARGDIANLYRVSQGLLKVTRDPADNDLMRAETIALAALRTRVERRFQAYFPELVLAQRRRDPSSGAEHRANVIVELTGFRSLAEIRSAVSHARPAPGPAGLDPRDAAWMWRRLLVAVGAAHRAGLIHGAVLPEHVMIHAGEHGLVLVDWCYSWPGLLGRAPAGRVRAVVKRYRDWYPHEVLSGHRAGPDLDIWLATRCMTELIGDLMPAPMAAFARGCLLASPSRRPADAWSLLAELDDLLERLYGPRTFRPFAMPA
jgi:serine/threonine protein kinase